jgi:SPP1 family predicted phage head-tail adaptor
LRIGKLRHRVTIQYNAADPETPDAHGQVVDDWQDLATCWAEVKQLDGRENYAAQKFDAKTTNLIRLRSDSCPTLSPRMQILWTDSKPSTPALHTYNVLFVDDADNRGIEKIAQCEEQGL